MAENVSAKAVDYVIEHENKKGCKVINVQHKKEFKGFDLISISKKGDSIKTIEVKGTTTNGIPDCFETEFTRNKKLVATHMYVVSYSNKKPDLYIIPASAFKPEHLQEKIYYKVSSTFNTKILPKFKTA